MILVLAGMFAADSERSYHAALTSLSSPVEMAGKKETADEEKTEEDRMEGKNEELWQASGEGDVEKMERLCLM